MNRKTIHEFTRIARIVEFIIPASLMGSEPLFSVVVPTYNRGPLLLQTIDTVLSQTYPNYEIVIVDDNSTDNTAESLQPLIKSGRVKYFKHEQNRERAQARNTGIDNASGDFVTFLDSDDFMYPENLSDAAKFVGANPGARLFHNLYELVDDERRVLCKYYFPDVKDPLQAITTSNFLSSVGVFIHREIFEHHRFDTNPILTGSEDWDFWLRVVPQHWPGRINKVNNGVLHHGDRSTVHIDLEELHRRFAYMIDKVETDSDLRLVYSRYLKRLRAGSLLYTSTVANLTRQHGEALRCLARAAALDPTMLGSISFIKACGIALLRWDKGY
jgi:glycosyltransferase involved in cell wall biosynthesis